MNNTLRNGAFTSSGIVAITTKDRSGKNFGAPALTYISECNYERWLQDTIDAEFNAKPTSWGKWVEELVFGKLGMDYSLTSDITLQHPNIPYWVGSPDGYKHVDGKKEAVIDFKAPFTKKSFVQLVLPLYLGYTGMEAMLAIRDGFNHNGFEYPKHKDGDKFYWQLVSNAIITGCDYAELIVYMPYVSELLEIKNLAGDNPELRWLDYTPEDQIPCIKDITDGGMFRNINIIRFKVPQADKDFLTECVLKGGELLITPTPPQPQPHVPYPHRTTNEATRPETIAAPNIGLGEDTGVLPVVV
jgi:hypothetical protein